MTYSLTVKMPDIPHTLTLYSDGEFLTATVFDCKEADDPDDICLTAAKQLEEYFAGERKTFSIPYTLYGGEFFKAVMRAAALIPYGHTATYGDVAASAGYNNAARAVGNVLSKNPLPIIIPCHRILPKSGGLGMREPNPSRPTTMPLGAFRPFRLDRRQPACASSDKNHLKFICRGVHSSFYGADFCQDEETERRHTVCMSSEVDEVFGEKMPVKTGLGSTPAYLGNYFGGKLNDIKEYLLKTEGII